MLRALPPHAGNQPGLRHLEGSTPWPQSTPDAEPEGAEIVIRYHNLGFALVTVTRLPSPYDYTATCSGCLDVLDDGHPRYLGTARTWANKHAGECRALARPEPTASARG